MGKGEGGQRGVAGGNTYDLADFLLLEHPAVLEAAKVAPVVINIKFLIGVRVTWSSWRMKSGV